MIYGIYQSAAGMAIQESRQTTLANNLANVETPGFKPDRVASVERPIEAAATFEPSARNRILDRMSGGLLESPVYTDFSSGTIDTTGNPLDLAIDGDGFFRVGTLEGERYTRDGRMTIGGDGSLVTVAGGAAVLDRTGRPIRVDPSTGQRVDIDANGNVRQGGETIGQIELADFVDRGALKKSGKNQFDASAAERRAATGTIRAGAVEQSGADPIKGLVEMIAASRAYQLNATMISLQDSTLQRVVNDVGRLG